MCSRDRRVWGVLSDRFPGYQKGEDEANGAWEERGQLCKRDHRRNKKTDSVGDWGGQSDGDGATSKLSHHKCTKISSFFCWRREQDWIG